MAGSDGKYNISVYKGSSYMGWVGFGNDYGCSGDDITVQELVSFWKGEPQTERSTLYNCITGQGGFNTDPTMEGLSYTEGGTIIDPNTQAKDMPFTEGAKMGLNLVLYIIEPAPVARVMMGPAGMIKSIITPDVEVFDDYSAIQGPCPEGFHLPTASELTALKSTLTTLGIATNEGLQRYLRMPLSGCREDWGGVYGAGTNGNYYSCSVSGNNAIRFFFGNTFTPNATINRAYGLTIRAFKDVPVVPDEDWTELYADPNATGGGLWPSGVYHNPTLGLISFSSDGEIWKTIADKNLGATSVYTYGASLTQANCGKYYQWGNNYGFAFTGSVTQSSTQVDTSGYGPGNYYSSSTFITGNGIDWSNQKNDNLWGITTGIIHHEEHIKTNGVYIITPQ